MDGIRRSVTKPEQAVDATRGRDVWRNLVLVGGKRWYSGVEKLSVGWRKTMVQWCGET